MCYRTKSLRYLRVSDTLCRKGIWLRGEHRLLQVLREGGEGKMELEHFVSAKKSTKEPIQRVKWQANH